MEDSPRPDRCHILINFLFIVYDLSEVSLQGSSAYQTAVDISLCEELCRIACVYRSAVLDTDRFCCRLVINFSDALADALAYFLSLLCCSCLSSSFGDTACFIRSTSRRLWAMMSVSMSCISKCSDEWLNEE